MNTNVDDSSKSSSKKIKTAGDWMVRVAYCSTEECFPLAWARWLNLNPIAVIPSKIGVSTFSSMHPDNVIQKNFRWRANPPAFLCLKQNGDDGQTAYVPIPPTLLMPQRVVDSETCAVVSKLGETVCENRKLSDTQLVLRELLVQYYSPVPLTVVHGMDMVTEAGLRMEMQLLGGKFQLIQSTHSTVKGFGLRYVGPPLKPIPKPKGATDIYA
jgi:hypothetical protein